MNNVKNNQYILQKIYRNFQLGESVTRLLDIIDCLEKLFLKGSFSVEKF